MPLNTVTGGDGKLRIFEGSAQEVLDAIEDAGASADKSKLLHMGRDGAGAYFALVAV